MPRSHRNVKKPVPLEPHKIIFFILKWDMATRSSYGVYVAVTGYT